MHTKSFRLLAVATLVLSFTHLSSATLTLNPDDAAEDLDTARRKIEARVPVQDLLVHGRQIIDRPVVVAGKIAFEPDSELVYSTKAQQSAAGLYLLAREIVSLDQNHPGRVVAERSVGEAEPIRAKDGADGQNGAGDGTAGGKGGKGEAGSTGASGESGPHLLLFVPHLASTHLIVQLNGTSGGRGGNGGDGGAGGIGARGESASQSAFDCKRGAGRGGDGGAGGNAGDGGLGGPGGKGGDLEIITQDLSVSGIVLIAHGGDGGAGGNPGRPGNGGAGGPQGDEQLPWCRGGHGDGSRGAQGGPGSVGHRGQQGMEGNVLLAIVPKERVDYAAQGLGGSTATP